MEPEDMLEMGGLGLLFGGLEILGAILGVVLVLALVAGVVAAFLWLDFGALQIVAMLALMFLAALLGGLGGMKVEQVRREFGEKYGEQIEGRF